MWSSRSHALYNFKIDFFLQLTDRSINHSPRKNDTQMTVTVQTRFSLEQQLVALI